MRLRSFFVAASLTLTACTPGLRAPANPGDAGADPIVITPVRPVAPKLDRAEVRAALQSRRAENIQRFLAYRDGRVYPVNDTGLGFQHVWLDGLGNLCAAATLISQDWGRDATSRVALENNFIALADVHDGPLHDWILTSGLTHHEIVAIQVPGWQGMRPDENPREQEIERLHALYVDVERQLATMQDDSLEDAVDDLMARPDLARALLDGVAAGPGKYALRLDPASPGLAQDERGIGFAATPSPGVPPASIGFAQPPG
jgi:hypothetical protein